MIGSTNQAEKEGKIKDVVPGDPLTEDELRGAVSTLAEKQADMNKGLDIMAKREGQIRHDATVQGLIDEVNMLKAMTAETNENNNKLIGLYQTLRNEFDQFRALHAAQMSMKLGGGPTNRES